MIIRSTPRTFKPAALLAGGMLALTTLTGCSSGPLDTKCGDFIEQSEAEQDKIVAAWNKENGMDGPLAEMSADSDRESMKAYCDDPDHADDKIKDLMMTFG